MRRHAKVSVAVASLFAFFAFMAGPALAARGHVFDESLTISSPGSGPGQLTEPSGVAVNETSGDVYVVDKGNNRVERFDGQTGAFLGQFDGSGSFEVEGTVESGPAAGSGGLPGEVEAPLLNPGSIAVDNSCHLRHLSATKCAEEDPSDGDVYVVDEGHRVIDKFTAKGEYVGQITGGSSGPFPNPLKGVAVDPQGAVWVSDETKEIFGFTNAVANVFSKLAGRIAEGSFGVSGGLGVDSEGNFYAPYGFSPTTRIVKAAPSPSQENMKVLIKELDDENSSAVAVEQTTDVSFVDNLTSVAIFSPEGVLLERLGEGHLSEGAGIGVNASTGFAYVADSAAGHLVVLGPEPPGPPTVEFGTQSASTVTAASATLEAEVNPRSVSGEEPTTYRFEYGPCATLATCAASPFQFSTPSASLPPDFEVHAVSAHISGLEPGTPYHFRLFASNENGDAEGEEDEAGEEILRTFTTQSAGVFSLPDARQWEMVSPPEKLGARIEPISESGVIQAAAGGGGITYLASTPIGSEPQGYDNSAQVLSTREGQGWSSRDIGIPHSAATGISVGSGQEYKFFSPDLSTSVVQPFGQFNPGLSPEASESTAFLHSLSTSCGSSCYRPLVTGKPGFENVAPGTGFGEDDLCKPQPVGGTTPFCGPEFLGASDDLNHIVLHSVSPLKTGAGEKQLYEWSDGELVQVSVLPEGGLAPKDASLGLRNMAARRAISDDGSRVIWESQPNNLYLRDTVREETVQLDEGEGCGGCESGGGQFQIASADGSRVFFTDANRLTADSGADSSSPPKLDLYECKIGENGSGELTCELTDLTPENSGESANVQGEVLGAGEDGSGLYFVAQGVQSETPNERGESAVAGRPNLYMRHGGVTSFITTLSSGDAEDWAAGGFLSFQPTRVSPNGRFLELMSEARLTGYDNRDVTTGRPVTEVYLYDAAANHLVCASCNPTGARPHGAANVPGWTDTAAAGQTKPRHQPRYLSDSGRLFFNANDGLVPQDSNGTEDVYQYEPPGVGDCTIASPTFDARSGGCVNLISSGGSGEESAFLDASENGNDVFFLTASQLATKEDVDTALDIYDAHACSASVPCFPPTPTPPPACEGDACQNPAPPPNDPTPSSLSFNGEGNVHQAHKRKHKHKKRHRKAHKAKSHKRANPNRGGQK